MKCLFIEIPHLREHHHFYLSPLAKFSTETNWLIKQCNDYVSILFLSNISKGTTDLSFSIRRLKGRFHARTPQTN